MKLTGRVISRKKVKLDSGGTLTLIGNIDIFSLSEADKMFVFELVDMLHNYEKPQGEQAQP